MSFLLASDLDRTLLYSKRFLTEYPTTAPLTLVENYKGEPLSYMSDQALTQLAWLNDHAHFVPVTTRTTAQYNRIFGITALQPRYAITTNGAEVLHKGEPDVRWAQHIAAQANPHYAQMYRYMTQLDGVARHYDVQHFMYAITTKPAPKEAVDVARELGFTMSQQGRKLYFVPSHLTKWQATAYVAEQCGANFIYAAGDSRLDVPLLEGAHAAVLMRHGTDGIDHLPTTTASGIAATEEMLATAIAHAKSVL